MSASVIQESMGTNRRTRPVAPARRIARNCVRNTSVWLKLNRMARRPSDGLAMGLSGSSPIDSSASREGSLSPPRSMVRIVTILPRMALTTRV